MNFRTLNLSDDLSQVSGLAVVIDVLRAYTTACFITANGARCIYPVSDLDIALQLKDQHPDWILVGERRGLQIEGSDYGNSPAKLETVDLQNKSVILTTSAGTQAVDKLIAASKIITGAFVNAKAIAEYIQKNSFEDIAFICTDNRWLDNEDHALAEYLTTLLTGHPQNFLQIKQKIMNHECSDGFLRNPFTTTSLLDFELAFQVDRFDFVIEARYDSKDIILVKAK